MRQSLDCCLSSSVFLCVLSVIITVQPLHNLQHNAIIFRGRSEFECVGVHDLETLRQAVIRLSDLLVLNHEFSRGMLI